MIWTAVAATGAVDEASLADFAFVGPSFGYRPGSFSPTPLTAYYNVVNTFHPDQGQNPLQPPWQNLELGATAPGDSQVAAVLLQVENCTGKLEQLCSVIIKGQGKSVCEKCNFKGRQIDFGKFAYFVAVVVARQDRAAQPFAHTLRVF